MHAAGGCAVGYFSPESLINNLKNAHECLQYTRITLWLWLWMRLTVSKLGVMNFGWHLLK